MSDSARTLYLVCYDVCKTPLRRRVQKDLTGYKIGGQKSFFECWLTPSELREVRETLAEWLDLAADRAGPRSLPQRGALGAGKRSPDHTTGPPTTSRHPPD
ncbi:MAG: CRISPR-associated endonuclease Cas2 [Candidatus Accumulibacter sp.]|uniref:CRISPR-associated endonuclease Cas2 n=1 Tax=Candidatus Accumulibacter affinis TaxID=2954384 RepID=A0A935W4E8_9PROT|nr:CRISPR-associated endonuclease Cas2 [Candidatus Accumulibacter affinis]